MAIFGAMLRDKTPENKSGMFQGQRIIGQVLVPGIIGPAIGAAVLANAEKILNSDGTESFLPNQNIFLAAFVAAVFIFAALLPLFRTLKKEK
jgi:MFS family permease